MIPRIDRNEDWRCPLVLELIDTLYNLPQRDTGVYIHWCEINCDPDSHPAILGDIEPHLPTNVIQDARAGNACIVFSTFQESTNPTGEYPIEHCHDFDLTLEAFCEQAQIPYSNVVWVSGDLRVQQRQKSKKIRAFGFTCYGHDIMRHVHEMHDQWGLLPITQRSFDADFICLQRYMKPGRIFWTWLLNDSELLDSNFVSVADRIHGWGFLDKARAFIYILDQHVKHISSKNITASEIKKIWHDLADIGLNTPRILDVPDHDSNWCAGSDTTVSSLPWYNTSFASVITETDIQSGGLFISEATFRSFVYQQPCIWIGQQGIVKQLNKWGFKTWDWLISEDYDNEPYMIDRLHKCKDSLEDLINIPRTPELLERIHQQNIYNWNHLQGEFKTGQQQRFMKMLNDIVNK
jgi:hypothetical protein